MRWLLGKLSIAAIYNGSVQPVLCNLVHFERRGQATVSAKITILHRTSQSQRHIVVHTST